MKKRPYYLVSILLLILSQNAAAKVAIFACEPEWASLASELGGEKLNVFASTTALQDPHRIEARPSLIAKVRQADLVICTGSDLEAGWLPLLLRQAGNSKVQAGQPGLFLASEVVERLEIHAHVDRSMGDVHPGGNPHVHLDPYRLATIAGALTQRLGEIDTANAAFYAERNKDFSTRWQAAIKTWETRAQPLKGIGVVTHHKDWTYLLHWLQIKEIATLEPKPGLPPAAGYLASLTSQLRQQPARLIIRAAYQEARPSTWLSEQTKIPAVILPYTVGGTPEAKDLFSLYDDTLTRLLGALQ